MFYFVLDEGGVIDGKIDGNSVCWINYLCVLNCEVEEVKGCVYIYVLCDIELEEELFYDYGFVIDVKLMKKFKCEYVCYCGVELCCGMLFVMFDEGGKKKKKKDKKDGKLVFGLKDKKYKK